MLSLIICLSYGLDQNLEGISKLSMCHCACAIEEIDGQFLSLRISRECLLYP